MFFYCCGASKRFSTVVVLSSAWYLFFLYLCVLFLFFVFVVVVFCIACLGVA